MRKNKLNFLFFIIAGLYSFNSFAISAFSKINFPPLEKKDDIVHIFPTSNKNIKLKNKDFKSFVVFGDSLSDVGVFSRENRYLAGGFSNTMGTEILSEYYTGKASAPPTTEGGQNYAITGTIADGTNHSSGRFSLKDLIDKYLLFNDITNNKIDSENLYFIWIGAMDINLDLLNKPLSVLTYDFKSPNYTINIAPLEITKQAKRLLDMGAKYLMVVNIPDSATAPITSVFYTDVINSALQSIPIINNISEIYFSKRRASVDRFLRNPNNRIHINGDKGKEYFIENGILGMQHLYFFLPKSLVRKLYMFAYNIQSDLTRQFSNTLNESLSKIDGPIVYIDFRAANYELIADPQKYGIDDIVSPTCTLGYSARLCDVDSPKYFNDKVYLTSDWFHPSPYANRLLASYIISVFDAPLYVSSIIKHQKLINDLRSDFLQNQLNIFMNSDNEINKLIPFFGYSGTYSLKEKSFIEHKSNYIQNFNIGVAYYLNDKNLIGIMTNLGYGKFIPHNNFNYHYNNESLTFFTQNKFDNNIWFNTNINVGRLSASDITRVAPLGDFAKEIEYSSTNGKNYGLEALLGYNIKINENIYHSPIMGVSLNRFNAKKYRERSNKSISMHFDPELFKFDYAFLGWKVNTINNPNIDTSLEISFNKRLSNKPIIVNGAVNSTNTSFFREYKYNKDWLNIKAGMNKNINNNFNVSFNIGYNGKFKKEINKEQNFNFSIGINGKF